MDELHMKNTIDIENSTRPGLYERIVLKSLSRMGKGRLEIRLPDGEQLIIGDGKGIRARMYIRDAAFYKRCILYGDVGFGEAYADGLWDTDDISAVISWALLNLNEAPGVPGAGRQANTLSGFRRNISEQHDQSNELFRLFLDPTMTYSGAYFERDGMNLEEAQKAKYRRLCQQLQLTAADHVLEIGSGWGGNAVYIAKNYGCRVTAVTISEEQYRLASLRVKAEGLEQQVTILLEDYRNLSGSFDKIVSVEMLETTGPRYLDTYFQKCHELLKQDGILALQVITCPDSRYDRLQKGVDRIRKHIFPGSLPPSVTAINAAIGRTGEMTLVDLKEMGLHYAATLKVWFMQFNSRLEEVRRLGFDDRFIRKWNYYHCYREAAFRMRNIHVMQLVYSRVNPLFFFEPAEKDHRHQA
jgi:cyclopropane-fatty-acyl-phospholipid synthase